MLKIVKSDRFKQLEDTEQENKRLSNDLKDLTRKLENVSLKNKSLESKNKNLVNENKMIVDKLVGLKKLVKDANTAKARSESSKGAYKAQRNTFKNQNQKLKEDIVFYQKQEERNNKIISNLTEQNQLLINENQKLKDTEKKLRDFIDKKINSKKTTTEEIKKYDKKSPVKKW